MLRRYRKQRALTGRKTRKSLFWNLSGIFQLLLILNHKQKTEPKQNVVATVGHVV